MPGVKGKSGRKPNNPNVANTPYLRKKMWRRADEDLARLKRDNPAHYARIMNVDGSIPCALPPGYVDDLVRYEEQKRLALFHLGRNRSNIKVSKRTHGAQRIRHATQDQAEAERLAQEIIQLYRQARTISNIAMIMTRRAERPISVKAVSKMLRDFGERPEGLKP